MSALSPEDARLLDPAYRALVLRESERRVEEEDALRRCDWPEDERDRASHFRNHPDCG